jgi:hypothetical protein
MCRGRTRRGRGASRERATEARGRNIASRARGDETFLLSFFRDVEKKRKHGICEIEKFQSRRATPVRPMVPDLLAPSPNNSREHAKDILGDDEYGSKHFGGGRNTILCGGDE